MNTGDGSRSRPSARRSRQTAAGWFTASGAAISPASCAFSRLKAAEAVTIPAGEQPAFSDDSRWMAYLIGFTEEQEAKLRKEKKPIRKQLGLLELATGQKTTIEGIESFALSPTGTHVAMRRYAAEAKDDGAAPTANSETVQPARR